MKGLNSKNKNIKSRIPLKRKPTMIRLKSSFFSISQDNLINYSRFMDNTCYWGHIKKVWYIVLLKKNYRASKKNYRASKKKGGSSKRKPPEVQMA